MNAEQTIQMPCGCPPVMSGINLVGDVHAAKVIDESGKGLQASFFFLDGEGNVLSPVWYTDAEGNFHWSIEQRPIDNVFINVTAGPGYEPQVFTPDELISNPTVILKKTGGSVPEWLLPAGLGLAAIVLISSHRGKSVSGVRDIYHKGKKKFNDLNPTVKKVVLIGAGGVTVFLLLKYLLKAKPTPEQANELAAYKNRLTELASRYGIIPSYGDPYYNSWAAEILKSFDDCGTDESAVYRVFDKMNNEADVIKLILAYGVGSFKGCFTQGSYFGNIHMTLSESLTSDMTNAEVGRVNDILSSHGINFSF